MLASVRLNHLYRVVDSSTYQALRTSDWLGTTFAPRDERTTTRPDWSYTGVYLYGRRTYVEFFDEGPQGPAGYTGLAFDLDAGHTSTVADAWAHRLGATRTAIVERRTDNGSVPWFHLASGDPDRRGGLHVWSMEYHSSFLASWRPELTPARSSDAADVLDRYTARVTDAPRDAFLLEDVTAIDLSLSREALRFLRGHVEVLVPVDERPRGFTATIGVTTIRADGADVPRGLLSLTCSLQRAVPRESRPYGASMLTLNGRTAVWQF